MFTGPEPRTYSFQNSCKSRSLATFSWYFVLIVLVLSKAVLVIEGWFCHRCPFEHEHRPSD